MSIINLHENFDSSSYVSMPVKAIKAGDKAQLSGMLSVQEKNTKAGAPYYLISINDGSDSVGGILFQNSPIFNFFTPYVGKATKAVICAKVVQNGAYKNISIENIYVEVPDSVDPAVQEKVSADKKSLIEGLIDTIVSSYIRQIVKNVYSEEVMEKVLNLPATEYSGYNYVGGLADLIITTGNMVQAMTFQINDDNSYEGSLVVNPDIMMAGALLCNIGRIHVLKWLREDMGAMGKTEAGVLSNDASLAHDMVLAEMNKLATEKNEDGTPAYNIRPDVNTEILHMVDSCKSQVSWGALSVPRTKHAMILASICQIAFAKGLFEDLEKRNPGQRVIKAYDAGRAYFLPEGYLDL